MLPLPKEVYKSNEIRHEDRELSLKLHNLLLLTYKNFGYNIIEVPAVSVEERVSFIKKKLKELT